MPSHPGRRHGSHLTRTDPDEEQQVGGGLFGRVVQGFKDTGKQIAFGAGLLDRAMRHIGDNPLDFLPGTGEARALGESRKSFSEGRPGLGLLSAVGAVPGIPRVRGLFKGLEGLRGSGLRVFARAESPGVRRVVSITPNPKPGGAVKATIFEETADQGPVLQNVEEFADVDEAVKAVSGGRGFFKGFEEVPVGPQNVMESRFERIAERGLFPRATRARAAARKRPGSVGGFFNQ